ncbi:MAG: 23S rRNA (adenine(2503)-C(2))-methyltransferase RlmN [Patescibacteria group bacterium]|nr:23S rRNA (adenine(2503)-C(2))-methyltransferase RlmN [Patescibacteria group bacterium]
MNIEELKNWLKENNAPEFRFKQIYQAKFFNLATNFEEITSLSKFLREKLNEIFSFSSLKINTLKEANNKKVYKALFNLEDNEQIESVLMMEDERRTVCISSQVGCPMGCLFCATGDLGFKRNLEIEEIFDQVLFWARYLKEKNLGKLTNLVVMGMGEPFLNYDSVLGALKILNDEKGFNFGQRRMSISTCGIVPGIEKFTAENCQVNLAISLHAPNDFLRSKIMPVNKKYPLQVLMPACFDYVNKTNRKLMFEYVMLKGFNDSQGQAKELADLLVHPLFHVNLIKYNYTNSKFGASDDRAIFFFQQELNKNGVSCTVRKSMGEEIWAGCGQLKLKSS